MTLPPAVVIHGLPHARLALRLGRPVTLLSAPGAPSYAGCAWWRALIAAARAEFPRSEPLDVLEPVLVEPVLSEREFAHHNHRPLLTEHSHGLVDGAYARIGNACGSHTATVRGVGWSCQSAADDGSASC